MEYFPLFVRLRGRHCLIFGGGSIALRKARGLLRAGASVEVVAEKFDSGFQELGEKALYLKQARIDAQAMATGEAFLVVAATSDRDLNAAIAERCEQLGILCNQASNAAGGDVSLPAIIERDPLVVAVHTGGASPALTRYLKRQLEAFLPVRLGALARWSERWRQRIAQAVPEDRARQGFWDRLLSGVAGQLVLQNDSDKADAVLQQALERAPASHSVGEVYLVGAGPGDPELLTLRALRLIQQAEVVLYDRLVSPGIMELLPPQCQRIYVGKQQSNHALPQPEINQRLVDLALAGHNVLRLKGGDPFIFGRGGEELELLADAGVPFQVVPGITAASGCSSYAGIPLTHRDHSQSVRFVTGHLQNNQINLPWPELAASNQTLVFYMGLTGLEAICAALMRHGRAATTPAAVVEKGTLPEQRVVTGTLQTLPQKVASEELRAPTLIIIGEVVSLRSKLQPDLQAGSGLEP